MGIGMALMALSNKPFPGRDFLSGIGKLTLGIYLIHPIFVALAGVVCFYTTSAWWEVAYVFVVLVLAVLAVKFLMRFERLRPFLT